MFLKNCWYVAAEPHEITRQPFGRTICNEKIVFWRTEDGDPVAFEDRCCHRRMPLRKGSVHGNVLSCHYHGLQFDVSGKCVHVPGQTTIPPGAQVRAFPVVEKYNWIWIWTGDPALADESLIVPYPWKSAEDWGDKGTYFHVNGNYKLVIDNLLDLSHLASSTVRRSATPRSRACGAQDPQGRGLGDGSALDRRPEPAAHLPEDVRLAGRDHRRPLADHRVPDAGRGTAVYRRSAGRGGRQGVRAYRARTRRAGQRFGFHNLNFVTPETETSTHYFWSNSYQVPGKPIEPDFVEMQYKQIWQAFHQDWEVFDLQEENWDDRPTIETNQDAGGIAARAMIDRKIAAETGGSGSGDRGRVVSGPLTAIRRHPGAALRFSGPRQGELGRAGCSSRTRGTWLPGTVRSAARTGCGGRCSTSRSCSTAAKTGRRWRSRTAAVTVTRRCRRQAPGRQCRVPLSRPPLRPVRPMHPGSRPDRGPARREGQGLPDRGALSLDLDLDGRPGGSRSRPDRGLSLDRRSRLARPRRKAGS